VAGSGKAGLAHQARDALAAVPFAQAAQQGVDAW
jgi:hypothetical protein